MDPLQYTSYRYFKCNEVVVSYAPVAEPLLRYFEDQAELLLDINKTVTTKN